MNDDAPARQESRTPSRLADRSPAPPPRADDTRVGSTAAAPPRADTPRAAQAAPPDLAKIAGAWDALVDAIRAVGKPMLASALQHASPVAVNASGVVTIALDEENDIFAHAISGGRADVLAELRRSFAGVERVELRRDEPSAPAAPPKRLTDEMVRAERIAALKKRDPVLRAAIDDLDLDVAD